jgi:hypothetical protein
VSDADEPGAPGAGHRASQRAGHRDEPRDEPSHEPVGSVGDEAAKLFGALSDWARDHDADTAAGAAASSAREALAAGMQGFGEHVSSAEGDCRYCPVCQVIHVVRQTSPEVRAHLGMAASSLMQAAAGLLATTPPPRGPVEKIDLDDEGWDEPPAGAPEGRQP